MYDRAAEVKLFETKRRFAKKRVSRERAVSFATDEMAPGMEGMTPEQKREAKKEKLRKLQREKEDPVEKHAAMKAEEERKAEEARLAREAAAKKAAAEKEASEAAARAEAERIRAEQEAIELAIARQEAAEERRYQAWLADEARKVKFGRHVDIESLNKGRDSSLLQGAYMRYMVVEQNRAIAERTRAESEELLLLKAENASQWSDRGRRRAQERLQEQDHGRKLKREMEERSRRQARQARKELEKGRRALHKQREAVRKEMRERIRESNAAYAKLGEAEEAHAVEQRKEGTRRKQEMAIAVANVRQQMRSDKQQVAVQIRGSFSYASTAELTEQVVAAATQNASQVRMAEKLWKVQRNRAEAAYVEVARQKCTTAHAQRQLTKMAVADSIEERRQAAEDLRTVTKEMRAESQAGKIRQVEDKLGAIVSGVYRARFATKEAADMYDSSAWMDLTGWYKPPKNGDSQALTLYDC